MKNNYESILGKYSDSKSVGKSKAKNEKKMPLMATYEQRYKGLTKTVTEPVPTPTLEEKIKAKAVKPVPPKKPERIPVTIGGNRYLLGTDEAMSEIRVHRIANLANQMLEEAKGTNPGLTNSKAAILALIDLCDLYIGLQDKNSNMKTELMYLQQQDFINKSAKAVEPTPMEKLADEVKEKENTKTNEKK